MKYEVQQGMSKCVNYRNSNLKKLNKELVKLV